MRLEIFLFFIIFVKFSSSQVVFPDATTTKPTTTKQTTMPPTTEPPHTTTEPMEETTEEEETEETTEEEAKTTTTLGTTEAPVVAESVTICAAIHQCQNIDGKSEDDGSGKMDVRVNNGGMTYNSTVGTKTQITTPASPGIATYVQSQTECPMKNITEPCMLTNGYKCGIGFQPVKGMPQMQGAAPYLGYPWEGLVMRSDPEDLYTYYAAGCLITHKHFITVANKVSKFVNAVNLIVVQMGEWNLAANVEPLKSLEFGVSAVMINPYYNNVTLTDNIALLVLASNVPLGQYPHIGTACLPKDDLTTSNIYCMVAGWGRSSKVADTTFVLKEVDQPLLNASYCQDVLRTSILGPSYELDTYSWICAGGEANKSNCDGDGGNPLVCNITGQWYVVGLASWSPVDQLCGANPYPELYVNINNQIPWIQYVITGLAKKPITTRASGIKTTTKKLGGATTLRNSPDFTTKSRTKMMTTMTHKLAGSTTSNSASTASSTRPAFTTKPKTKAPDTVTSKNLPTEVTTKKLGGQTVQTSSGFTTQSKTKMTTKTNASIDSRGAANYTSKPITTTTSKKVNKAG